MRVALIGPPMSGKSTLFTAVAASGGSNVDMSRPDQPHLAVVKVPDARLDQLAEMYQPKKFTPAELEFLDLPGMDLSSTAGRNRSKSHWAQMRQCDMLVYVVRAFKDTSVGEYRDRIDSKGDVDELKNEMLFADLEQVTNRIEKLEAAVKKPTVKRDEQQKELDLMTRLQETLELEKPLADVETTPSQAKLLRSFMFLSQKPVVVVINCSEAEIGDQLGEVSGTPAIGLSAQIEEEIAQLPDTDRAEFLADMGLADSARDRLIRICYEQMNLVSFLTVGSDECRAWTIPANTDAVVSAEAIHSDIARGFIRAETVAYDDLVEAGDMKLAKAAGKVRLEGKTYKVLDGDIINFRFNV